MNISIKTSGSKFDIRNVYLDGMPEMLNTKYDNADIVETPKTYNFSEKQIHLYLEE